MKSRYYTKFRFSQCCNMPLRSIRYLYALQTYLFLAKRGRRPRVAGFIILSLKGLRRDEISCGVYGHVYLFIYLFICEVGVCRK